MPVYTFNQIGLLLIFSFFQSGPLACFPFVIDLCCVICLFVCFCFFSTYQFRASDLIAEDLVFCLSLSGKAFHLCPDEMREQRCVFTSWQHGPKP